MVRQRAVVLVLINACSIDLGIEDMRYRCENDSQCAVRFSCDRILGICSEPGDAEPIDAGPPPCGFDEEFGGLEPEGWQGNGNTSSFPDFVQLTPVESNRKGTLWHTRRIRAERFTFEMVFSIFGGGTSGGDGMTIAWVEEDATASGGGTGNLGVYGLHGYVVELDTFPNSGLNDPAEEHITFARTFGELLPDVEQLGTSTALPELRSQEQRKLRLEFNRGVARIFLDEGLVLTATTAGYQPFEATFGATAATGARSDSHNVHRLTLICR